MADPSDITIRPARRDDVPALGALAAEFAHYMRSVGDQTEFRLTAEAIERDGFGEHPAFEGLVAERGGGVVGYLLFHNAYDTDAACRLLMVVDLFVTAASRGGGIGEALMRRACGIAAARGAERVVWTVYRGNRSARHFYERIGAQRIEELDLMFIDAKAGQATPTDAACRGM